MNYFSPKLCTCVSLYEYMHVNITDFLDLELLDVVSHYVWVLEIEPSAREESALNSRPFLKLCNLFF